MNVSISLNQNDREYLATIKFPSRYLRITERILQGTAVDMHELIFFFDFLITLGNELEQTGKENAKRLKILIDVLAKGTYSNNTLSQL